MQHRPSAQALDAAPLHGQAGQAQDSAMPKILTLIILAMMVVHLIRPLGLPGLRKRKDFWKLAAFAIAAMMVTVLLRP